MLLLIVSSMAIASGQADRADANAGELIGYAKRLSELENYDGAGVLYERIALHYRNASDLANASMHYVLAAENFESAGDHGSAAANYRLAGDCCTGQKECDTALKYYELAREGYRKND
jgi:tetratricopeptide (TPR) repeat protein